MSTQEIEDVIVIVTVYRSLILRRPEVTRSVSKFAMLAQKETRWVTAQMGGAQIGAAHNGSNQANLSIPIGLGKTNNDYPINSTGI